MAVDLVIARENTEGFYADRNMFVGSGEFMPTPDVALSVRKITREGCTRIAEVAFALAMRRRKKVTAVHKANVFRVSENIFPRLLRAVAARYPSVQLEEIIVDAMAAYLVRDASRFEWSSPPTCSARFCPTSLRDAGSLGLAPSISHGDVHGVAQAQHGSAPDIAGQDRPSHLADRLGGDAARLARRPSQGQQAARRRGCYRAGARPTHRGPAVATRDIGGPLGTKAFGERVAAMLDQGVARS